MGTRSEARGAARVPPWILLVLILAAAWTLVQRLGVSAEQRGVAVIDPLRYRLHARSGWTSPAWRARLEHLLAPLGSISAEDREGIEDLRAQLEALSFVLEVGEPEVLWPDGLSVPLRLAEPVACVRVRDEYWPVAENGTLLDGAAPAPHAAFGGALPVIGPNDGSLDFARPGELLHDPRHVAGLEVAKSFWRHLAPETIERIGPILIDASREHAPDGLPGGVLIDLEARRRVLFGRAPGPGFPGELSLAAKWRNVERAVESLGRGVDWSLFDARWDVPESFRLAYGE